MLRLVEAKLEFEGLHHWPDAPDAVKYLSYPHRHVFVVRAKKEVTHNDRDVEFQLLSAQIWDRLSATYPIYHDLNPALDLGSTSCEMLAELLLREFDLASCSVHEDDEHGAHVINDQPRGMQREDAIEALNRGDFRGFVMCKPQD